MEGTPAAGPLEGHLARTRQAFEEALRRGDAGAAAEVYAHDARLVSPSAQVFEGREAIAAFWGTGLGAGFFDVELEALELELQDGLAFEIGRYVLRVDSAEAGPVTDRGSYVLVHTRQHDGSWLRAVETFTPAYPSDRPVALPAARLVPAPTSSSHDTPTQEGT